MALYDEFLKQHKSRIPNNDFRLTTKESLLAASICAAVEVILGKSVVQEFLNRKVVNEIVKNNLGQLCDPPVTFEQMDADSLDLLSMLMELEERFDIEINDVDAVKLKTIDDVCVYLDSRGI